METTENIDKFLRFKKLIAEYESRDLLEAKANLFLKSLEKFEVKLSKKHKPMTRAVFKFNSLKDFSFIRTCSFPSGKKIKTIELDNIRSSSLSKSLRFRYFFSMLSRTKFLLKFDRKNWQIDSCDSRLVKMLLEDD